MRKSYALFCDAPWNWISVGLGGTIRTNVSRVEMEAAARGLGIDITPAIYVDIRVMEEEAIRYWSRKRR